MAHQEPIAIVGIGCRFPGSANSPSKLWDVLRSPRDLAKRIPKQRWNLDKFYHPTGSHHGTTNVTESYFFDEGDDIRYFDTNFFGVGAAEAEAMDPQHRMLLEVVYEAMEQGGFPLSSLQNSDTAVYVGMMCTDYNITLGLDSTFIPQYTATGVSPSNASSRISYYFNWHGPSMTIDTACSSSLVAVHQAVDHLRTGRSRVATACGTNLMINVSPYLTESKLNMLSPTGRSRMWDADADGYARGDGVAAVLLKRLGDAVADGDAIHGVIRNTGFTHDGRTLGITMPSGRAQADLIRRTYAEAGLDLGDRRNWPQFFEAHGTGTPVGDPQEASALVSAFYPGDDDAYAEDDTLLVGSVKTLVGHTEGTAGLAGLLKACLALKHAEIPPNLLFDRLSPGVAPYYKHLRIPTRLQQWPAVADGQPRRASVNSFGFGGTDAHAILESYEQPETANRRESRPVLPFTFSAASEDALRGLLVKYETYLGGNEDVSLGDVGYTLSCRRSALPYKLAVSASTREDLTAKIHALVQEAEQNTDDGPPWAVRTSSEPSTSYLGIFTGQGAQWPRMGYELVTSSPVASSILADLQHSLDALPAVEDRPGWTLLGELAADDESSRVSGAEISQPLCTAVQIILVELLKVAGIRFEAVVGHSSGEIGAAYAAGLLSAADAIRVAYYRGFWTTRRVHDGERGAMLAVGTSYEDALALCESEDMEGRITVAAVNSASSVTLSGDESAVLLAKDIFEEEGKFSRLLRVDKAYHSHHMLACSEEYEQSLESCGIRWLGPTGADAAVKWYSSVDVGEVFTSSQGQSPSSSSLLSSTYWVRNMTSSVQFEGALKSALAAHTVDLVVEVGPHPALKGPATDTMQASSPLPYFGTLQREKNDVEAFANLLGDIWTLRGPESLRLKAYQDSFGGGPAQLISDLPTYAWDHDRLLWWEARSTRNYLRQEDKFHDLLGSKTPDGSAEEMKWINWLKADEIPWLSGHSLQGQQVFPGAGYLVMAMEAGMRLAGDHPVQLIEFNDVDIRKALAIPNSGAETVVALSCVRWELPDPKTSVRGRITARFTCSTPPSKEAGELLVNCCCEVVIHLGAHDADVLAPRSPAPPAMAEVDVEDFYAAMTKLGYYYEGPFKSITSLRRKLDVSSGTVRKPAREADSHETPLLVHPGMLDSVLQALFAAYSAPGDNRLWSMHAPRHIKRIRVVPGFCGEAGMPDELAFDTVLTDATQRNRMVGDVDLYTAGFGHKLLEIEGLAFVPLSKFSEADDRRVFAKYAWVADTPCGQRALAETTGFDVPADGLDKATALERISFFYLRAIRDTLRAESAREDRPSPLAPHRLALMRWTDHIFDLVRSGRHPYIPSEWLDDTQATIDRVSSPIADDADVRLGITVGRNLPEVIRGDENILAYMMENDLLDRYYEQGLGLADLNRWSANLAVQISSKHPQMAIVEIGAGTGGTTKGIVSALGEEGGFASYTYTDVSTSFFEKARENLAAWEDRFEYKPLNIEAEPAAQGFAREAYDLAVAGNVLHATRHLGETLRNTRSLLKPGGFLMAVECVDDTAIRAGFVQGGLEGWWIGAETGRPWGPTVSLAEWDGLLRANGFAGVETATPVLNGLYNQASVWLARAVDEDFRILREPLAVSEPSSRPYTVSDLVLLGTKTGRHSQELAQLICDAVSQAQSRNSNVRVEKVHDVATLESLMPLDGKDGVRLPDNCTIVSLVELDAPIFKDLTETRWEALKKALVPCSSILWLTAGARNGIEPFAAMTAGVVRTLVNEMGVTSFQMLDVDSAADLPAALVTETALKLAVQHEWRSKGVEKNMTWTFEPEYAFEDGVLKVLRVVPDAEKNDRYNSLHRRITRPVKSHTTETNASEAPLVRVLWNAPEECWNLRESPATTVQSSIDALVRSGFQSEELLTLNVRYSLLSSVRTPAGQLTLVVGTDAADNDVQYVCASPSHASTVVVPRACAVPTSGDSIIQPFLSYVTGFLICHRLFEVIPPGGSVLLHSPDSVFAGIFAKLAADRHIRVRFTSSDLAKASKRNWVHLHPRSPGRAIAAAVPRKLDVFVDMSGYGTLVEDEDLTEQGPERVLSAVLRENLPASTARYDMSLFLAAETEPLDTFASLIRSESVSENLAQLLRDGNKLATDLLYDIPDGMPLPMVPINEISTAQETFKREKDLRIIGWAESDPSSSSSAVEIEVEPVDRRPDLFRGDETYWLVGLAGDMGRSLCDWMIDHGARYIVLSSRNPQLPPDWLAAHHSKEGVHIAGVAVNRSLTQKHHSDITSFESTARAKSEIVDTLRFPRIAGVANGAMILRDRPMLETDLPTLRDVLGPKVDGTLHLDALFPAAAAAGGLSWFVALTSFASIIGNMGQMAYSAANSFQTALVRNRRARGLCGSAVDVNMVVGVGYVERERRSGGLDRHAADRLLHRSQLLPVSEPDLHQMFAEAVLACRRRGGAAGEDAELITGLRRLTPEQAADTFWATNPKFSHWIRHDRAGRGQGGAGQQEARVPLKSRLAQVTRPEQAFGIIKDAMLSKLRLALSTEKLDPSMPLVDLGVDSLVAVLLRNWSIQETGVDVPVLKTLGGDSIVEIADFIVERLDLGGRDEATDDSSSASTDKRGSVSGLSGASTPTSLSVESVGVVGSK
ncbi:Polyketide synthase-nonribosomal peptide synthetase [Colletotrichum orbiculare MAFF 240422]|uniref:Polyketide synthase-nonribosomal peptide synthetase n=1 Tax=Colletotrichum orbiculare (strain 104-T / ATCC 96160 / CBS 514.97 / LARS 414 / MAFF 240422) TaxID=1213857 RepID=A0A484FGL0_COLOR|nr:Polyketide synthase-nonribosomal peptide synthetase [Colletotrichum orbiculare MAFF 240422]